MSSMDSESSGANRIQVRSVDADLALTNREAPPQLMATLSPTYLIVLYAAQVLVRVRPPIGPEANEELAVACSPTQEHIQARHSHTNNTFSHSEPSLIPAAAVAEAESYCS